MFIIQHHAFYSYSFFNSFGSINFLYILLFSVPSTLLITVYLTQCAVIKLVFCHVL